MGLFDAPTATYAQEIFVKILALCYFSAFLSLYLQVLGLYGLKGIASIHQLLSNVKERFPEKCKTLVPTLFWWRSDDRFLVLSAFSGILFSLLLFTGIFPPLFLLLLFVLYFSFLQVGEPFLMFQWDTLLLEATVAGFFYTCMTPPPLMVVVWFWVMFFRFMFASGIVKLLSGCPCWRSLTAMKYHFETQPLPNFGGFLAHHLLMPVTKVVCLSVFFFELIVPLLYLGTIEMRAAGALLTIFFQFTIIATGNYAFFNLLTIALCMPLIDNRYLEWYAPLSTSLWTFHPHLILSIVLNVVGTFMVLVNILALIRQLFRFYGCDVFLNQLYRMNILSQYGLFAVMTTVRNEIEIEGSDDGRHWQDYEFKYKPGALNHPLRQIAPLQPRLDWQMWFAALGRYEHSPYFQQLVYSLLTNEKTVLDLLKSNPFPHAPPKIVRAKLYRYQFNSFTGWWKTGNYWTRSYLGPYLGESSLQE